MMLYSAASLVREVIDNSASNRPLGVKLSIPKVDHPIDCQNS